MFPVRHGLTIVTSALLLFAALSAVPSSVLAAPGATPEATPTATPTATPRSALGNISTRADVGLGDDVLIAGFIVTGTQPKKVIIRALGPSLPLAEHLDNPTLELYDSSGTLLDSNDDWVNSPNKQAIVASTIPPTNDSESAIVAMLPAKGASYTAIVRGVNEGTGIGVVEVYDLDPAVGTGPGLANISTRGLVSGGDKLLIAGTIVVDSTTQKVIIRAIGPSLPLTGKLADPKLELRDANGAVFTNNDWGDNSAADKQVISDNGLQPTNPLESVIVATLPVGNATAIVRDKGVPDTGASAVPSPTVSRLQFGSGNTIESQRVQFAGTPVGGTFRLKFTRPTSIVAGQPGDKAALEDTIAIPWNATADDIKTAIMASTQFYRYDQNNNLTAGPYGFHVLFDNGGGFGIAGNEGFRREPVVTGSVTDFTIQFGTLTEGAVGFRNTWIQGLPLVQVDDSSIIYNGGVAVVQVYALP